MNTEQLTALGKNAREWARCYVALVEALMTEGVTEEVAREEARNAANMAALWDEATGEACPLCGRGE